MNLQEYASHDGIGLAQLVKRREVSAAELRATALAAIAQVNPGLNAAVDTVEAWPQFTEQAPAAGPFEGVPFGIKDFVLFCAGVPINFGSRLVNGALIAPFDSELMTRFKRAGLQTLARTTSSEMAFNPTAEAVLYGPTRNPWDPTRSSGGSSGGSAALVAAGALPVAHANDGGGSIRIPAANCGLVGLKPSRGRVSLAPTMGQGLHGLGCEFIVSRSVRDSAAMLEAVHGPAAGEPFVVAPPEIPYLAQIAESSRPLRIAFTTRTPHGLDIDPAFVRATHTTARLLEGLGHHVEEASPGFDSAEFDRASLVMWSSFLTASIANLCAMLGREPGSHNLEASVWGTYCFGRQLKATDLEAALATQNAVTRAVGAFFERYDLLLSTTMTKPPVPLGTLDANAERFANDAPAWFEFAFKGHTPFTSVQNMTGQPAISLPLMESDGLPIGMHFSARFGAEGLLLQLARQLEQALPWAGRRPRVHVAGQTG
jgi:amidase